jgi:hypothetical protein
MKFLKFSLSSDMLILGERFKKGQYRPVITTIPYSQITGALQARYGNGKYGKEASQIHACGHFLFNNEMEFRESKIEVLSYAPRERATNLSILPIYTEYLRDVKGFVYIKETGDIYKIVEDSRKKGLRVLMGGFKSKGFGMCELNYEETLDIAEELEEGELNTRLPLAKVESCNEKSEEINSCLISGKGTPFLKETFGIKEIKTANFGYLFEPLSRTQGKYVLSLFEGSIVVAPKFLLKGKEGDQKLESQKDLVEKIVEEIKNDEKVKEALSQRPFGNTLLNTVGDVYEKEGVGTTRIYLSDKMTKRYEKKQAKAILNVINILEKYPSIDRATGRYIIKTINTYIGEEND